jgi:hypothetical protein
MGRKRYTEEQIAFAIRQHESGTAIAELIRKMGISEQTFYRWNKKFAGMIWDCDRKRRVLLTRPTTRSLDGQSSTSAMIWASRDR